MGGPRVNNNNNYDGGAAVTAAVVVSAIIAGVGLCTCTRRVYYYMYIGVVCVRENTITARMCVRITVFSPGVSVPVAPLPPPPRTAIVHGGSPLIK